MHGMKYIKALIGIIIAVWLVTMIMGSRIKPGGWFFPVRVNINEPLWVWVHITAPGRATTLQNVLDTRYVELEHAWFARDQKQIVAAQAALQRTTETVLTYVQEYTSAGDYKVADSLAVFSISMASIHGQVLETLITHGAVAQTMPDVAFVKGSILALQDARTEEVKKFATAYSKEDLVRGIDAQLSATRDLQDVTQGELRDASSLLQPEQKAALTTMLADTQASYELAKSKLGIDQYVESFVVASTTQGRLQEIRVALRATRDFGVPVIPVEKLPAK